MNKKAKVLDLTIEQETMKHLRTMFKLRLLAESPSPYKASIRLPVKWNTMNNRRLAPP